MAEPGWTRGLDADITARYGSTAGAALDFLYFTQYTFNEETNGRGTHSQHSRRWPC
jgi:hypothetical protein